MKKTTSAQGDNDHKADADVVSTVSAPLSATTGEGPVLNHGNGATVMTDSKPIEKSLKRKLDLILLPTVMIIYIENYIDRNAISSARLSGLEADLNLTDVQYQTCLSVLFLFYITLQIPSNLFLVWCGRPRLYIGFFVALWGTVSALTGVVKNYHQLLGLRILLGAVEAPFFPAALYLLSSWFTKKELTVRMSLLYAASLLSNAFASLIAAGVLGNMDGYRGIRGWRWLYILLGSITAGTGLLAMLILPDFPHNTKHLAFSDRELKVATQRLAEDSGSVGHDGDGPGGSPWQGLSMSVRDPKVWAFVVMLFAVVLGASFNIFFPTLVKTLGYPKIETLLLTAPPWIFGVIVVYFNALHADKTGERFFHVAVPLLVGVLGFIIAAATTNTGARFFAMFLMTAGYGGYTTILSWASTTMARPAYKRAAALAMINCISNLGNLVGSYVWPVKFGPRYWQSFTVAAVCFLTAIVLALGLRVHLTRLNREMDRTQGVETDKTPGVGIRAADDIEGTEGLDDRQRVIRAKANFRYLV